MQIGQGMVSRTYEQNGIVSKQYFTPFREYSGRNIKSHWKNETKALQLLKGKKHFPQLIDIDHSNRIIYMSHCGDPLTKENLPKNWKKQCVEIEATLLKHDIYHFDLIGKDANPNPPYNKNIHVKDGIIYLIDFGIWAKQYSKNLDNITDIVSQVAKL